MTPSHDYSEICAALSRFVAPGTVFEVRCLHASRRRTDAGYFDNPAHAATAIAATTEPYAGIYFTPNPVVPDLAARSYNRLKAYADLTTMDGDILSRKWLLIDIDPDRPSGISSTDAELQNAFKVAKIVANALELEGWPRPHINASGNGCHLMYSIDEPNNEFVRDEIAKFLKILNVKYKLFGCSVDTSVFNAARIFRVPGTWAKKGDNIPFRPHRKAHLLQVPEPLKQVTLAQICQFNSRNDGLIVKTPVNGSKAKTEYPDDEKRFRGLNDQAMNRLSEWVPVLFPTAKPYKQGYRIASADLGLSYEEDLTIHPWPLGIKYFGVADQGDPTEGRRFPVGLVAEFCFNGDKVAAAHKLGDILKAPVSEFAPIPVNPVKPVDTPNPFGMLPNGEAFQKRYDFSRVPSMAQLQAKHFKERTWIIKDVLPTGNMMLAARPKMRKTFLALQLALAVAGGRKFLNWQCTQADVLFLALEDNERRLQSRIKLLQMFEMNPPDLSGFRYWTGGVDISPVTGQMFVSDPDQHAQTYQTFPRGVAGVEALKKYLDVFPKTKLIIIDTYAHFREQSNNRDVYQRDYDAMMPITRLAAEREVCIMLVHHEKKGLAAQESGDFMEDISGTSGITGAIDGAISIKGKRGVQAENESRKLLISGRDIPRDFEIDISFDAERGGWLTAARQDLQQAIKSLLEKHRFMTQQEISSLMPNISRSRISTVLVQMKYEGLIRQSKYGYELAREKYGEF